MSKVKAVLAGKALTLLGYDGSDFYNVLIDALGHVQVDVLTSGLPAGGATEATLLTLATDAKLELCRLLLVSIEGKDFATGVDIATIVTELALKADLTETQPVSAAALPLPLGAATEGTLANMATEAKLELCRVLLAAIDLRDTDSRITQLALLTELQLKADLTETQPVSAASLPLPTGAATSANQGTIVLALQRIDDLQGALESMSTDRLKVRGEDQLFSFSEVLSVGVMSVISGAGGNISLGGVPAGEVWVVTGIEAGDLTSPTTEHMYALWHSGGLGGFYSVREAFESAIRSNYAGHIYMTEGDEIYVTFGGGQAGDTCYLGFIGYRMTLET